MSRRHAFYKMMALVQEADIVVAELGLPMAESLGSESKVLAYSHSVRKSLRHPGKGGAVTYMGPCSSCRVSGRVQA